MKKFFNVFGPCKWAKYHKFPTTMSRAIAVVVVLAAAVAAADVGELNNEPIYIVTVPASVSNSFNSASPAFTVTKTLGGATTESSYAEFFAETAAGTLVKKGPGWLTVDEGLVNWTGQIVVDEGVFCGACSNALGKVMVDAESETVYSTDADGTFVHAGATLVMDASFCPAGPTREKKKLTLAGHGAPGMGGALVARARGLANNTAWPWGDNPTIVADTTIVNDVKAVRLSFNRLKFPCEAMDLQGHTLTITNGVELAGPDLNYNRGVISNGNVVVKGTLLHIQNATTEFSGGPSNVLTFENGAALQFEQVYSARNYWTIRVNDLGRLDVTEWTTSRGWGDCSTNSCAAWYGTFELNDDLRVYSDGVPVGFSMFGPLTGTGGIRTYKGHKRAIWLHLCNPANTFTGGIGVRDTVVQAYAPGAIPAAGGNLAITNGALYLGAADGYSPDLLSLSLPPAEFSGTGVVCRGSGTWRDSLVKTDSGELVLNTTMGAPLLDVRGGGVRLACRGTPGLYEGVEDHNVGTTGDGWYARQTSLFSTTTDPHLSTNCVRLLPRLAYRAGTKGGWGVRYYVNYCGYIWNRSGETQNWTFYGGIVEGHEICLDGNSVIYRKGNGNSIYGDRATIAVTPGPHALRIRMYTTTSVSDTGGGAIGSNVKNPAGDGTYSWTSNFGMAFDRQGRNSLNWQDYEKIEDPGDGSLLTVSTNAAVDGVAARCELQKLRMAAGTYVDFNALDGEPYVMTELSGAGAAVSNVNLRVDGPWTVSAAALAAGPLAVKGTLSFTGAATLSVSDLSDLSREDHVLCTATGGITGTPAFAVGEPLLARRWRWRPSADGKSVTLAYACGLKMIIR